MQVGDYVVSVKDSSKIIYTISSIINNIAHIKGVNYRIARIVSIDELRLAKKEEIELENKKTQKYQFKLNNLKVRDQKKYILGRILHIDGDSTYLEKCLELYKTVGIYANGLCIKEDEMPRKIGQLIYDINPDIVVITGHDVYNNNGIKDLKNYSNTGNFIEVVKNIRKIKSKYDCTIVAGACQSNFEALIAAGSDFASSPKRINIHTFDPAVVAIKIATTSITKIVNLEEALKYIDNGRDAYGGLETLGKMRLIL